MLKYILRLFKLFDKPKQVTKYFYITDTNNVTHIMMGYYFTQCDKLTQHNWTKPDDNKPANMCVNCLNTVPQYVINLYFNKEIANNLMGVK